MRPRFVLVAALVALVATLGTGCRMHSLAFREDHRLAIVAPEDRSEVTLPVTVQWELADRTGVDSFVVVVDGTPQPPGERLDHLVKDDDSCRGDAVIFCLRAQQLEQRGVYRVKQSQISFPTLPPRNGVSKSEENRHEVTVALLDKDGRRMGEASWTVTFTAAVPA